MSLEKAGISWSFQQLSRMIADGKIDLAHIVQRGLAWERSRQSALIESAIVGYPIPPVFAKKSDGADGVRVYSVMDGKQRLSSIHQFMTNKYALTALLPLSYIDHEDGKTKEVDLTGKRFRDLPESLQNLIRTLSVDVVYFDNLTSDEELELFKRLNAGKPLSNKSKLLANCKDLSGVMDIGSHPVFDEMLSATAKDNKAQVAIVIKAWHMLNKRIDTLSFESKAFNPQIKNTVITDEERAQLDAVFDTIYLTHQFMVDSRWKFAAKKIYTETHFVSIVPFVKACLDENREIEEIAAWLDSFFGVKKIASISDVYNNACLGGSAKPYNIQARHNALSMHYNDFFHLNESPQDEPELTGEYKQIVDSIIADMC